MLGSIAIENVKQVKMFSLIENDWAMLKINRFLKEQNIEFLL